MDSRWLASAVQHWAFSERMTGTIARLVPAGGSILEVGCGPGATGLLLSAMGYEYVGIDQEEKLIDLAKDRAERLGSTARFRTGNAFDLSPIEGTFDLAFSSGVLEHFDREVTIELLREQSKLARTVVLSIPTTWTRYAGGVTDERFYSMRGLRALVKAAGLEPFLSFGYGDISATHLHAAIRLLLPRAALRVAQDFGYAYSIAVAGKALRADSSSQP